MATQRKKRQSQSEIKIVEVLPVPTPTLEESPLADFTIVNQTEEANKWFPIDWNKVKTLEDIKVIMKNMGLGCSIDAPAYETLKRFL
jgi:hypothetical protein